MTSPASRSPRESVYAEIGRAIELARVSAGISQAELGRRLLHPLTRAAIGNIELGRQRILTHTLIEVASVLRIRPRALLPARPPGPRIDPDIDVEEAHKSIVAGCVAQGISPKIAEDVARVVCSNASDAHERTSVRSCSIDPRPRETPRRPRSA